MKILIADSFPDTHCLSLQQMGHEVSVDAGLNENSLADSITDHEILVVRSTKVTAAVMDAASELKLIIRAGAGTNTIDCAEAAGKAIRVCNVPGANALAVAELVLGLIISIDRDIPNNVADLRKGIWNKKKYSKSRGLYGQKLGIIGVGSIGLAVAERARAFGMSLYTVPRAGRSESAIQRIEATGIIELERQAHLLETCDIVSLHLPSTEETRGMVNKDFLDKMKPGAMLINSSRGELIDEAALIEAMNKKGIRAGLDVYQDEPASSEGTFSSALASHPSVCGTHHIGASTEQAQTAVADGVISVIAAFKDGTIINCVNS